MHLFALLSMELHNYVLPKLGIPVLHVNVHPRPGSPVSPPASPKQKWFVVQLACVLYCFQLERFLCPECSKVRCICPKSDVDISPQPNSQQSVHPCDNHQPVNRNPVRNLFSLSSPERPEIPPTQNENGFGKDKRNSMPEPQIAERHWLSGLMNNTSPNQNGHGRPNAHHTSNVELHRNHAVENSNSPVQRAEPPAPRTLSLFSRGTSFRRSTVPPRPPRSPTKSRPAPPSS